jgi:hypothetical protein
MQDTHSTLQNIPESGERPVTPELLQAIKAGVEDIARTTDAGHWGQRALNDEIRLCRWPDQHPDGRKHKSSDGKVPRPFEGASDARLRVADMIVKFKSALLVAAALRSQPAMLPMEVNDGATAARLATAVKWVRKNMLGSRFRREIKRLANWIKHDGFAVMAVTWHECRIVRHEQWTLDELAMEFAARQAAANGQPDPTIDPELDTNALEQDLALFRETFVNPDEKENALAILGDWFPDLSAKRLRAIRKDLAETGTASVPTPAYGPAYPKLTAMRVWDDIFFDPNCGDLQEAHLIYQREFLTETAVRARAAIEEWDEAFVDELIGDPANNTGGYRGKSSLYQWEAEQSLLANTIGTELEEHKYEYEILTAWRKHVDPSGNVSMSTVVFSSFCNVAATNEVPVPYDHGLFPFVFFGNEVLSARLLDSRSDVELAQTDQSILKLITDSLLNHVQTTANPPLKVPMNRPHTDFIISPHGQIKEARPGTVDYLRGPEYPRLALDMIGISNRNLSQFRGVPHAEVPEVITQIINQDEIDDFLDGIADVYLQMISLCVQKMDPEQLARIAGGPLQIDRSPQAIANSYNLTVSYDVRHLDQAFVTTFAETLSKVILPMDERGMFMREKILGTIMYMFDPNLADLSIQPDNVAQANEAEQEEKEIARLLSGFPVKTLEYSANVAFGLRYQVLQEWMTANDKLQQTLPDNILQNLQAHAANLQQQAQQQVNAVTGRAGVEATDMAGEG